MLELDCLFVNIKKDSYHQNTKIDAIEIRLHYNYLVDMYFINILADNVMLKSNVPVIPNIDMFKGLKFTTRENQPIGSLYFNYPDKESICKDDLFKLDLLYFKEVV